MPDPRTGPSPAAPAAPAAPGAPDSPSLRTRLIRALLAPLLLSLAMATIAAYYLVLTPALTAFDQSLSDAALALAAYLHPSADGPAMRLPSDAERMVRTDEFDRIYFAARDADGRLIAGDEGLETRRPEDGDRVFFDSVFHGAPLRAVSMLLRTDEGVVTVTVAETTRKRQQLLAEIAIGVFGPLALLALAALATIARGTRRGLEPLESLSHALALRSPANLERIDEPGAAAEIRPMVHALNELLGRLEGARSQQQQFIADAAHQLRTPLAGLSLSLGLAREADDPATRSRYLDEAFAATQRTIHLANQLLVLSAAEPGGRSDEHFAATDLADLVAAAAPGWIRRAERAGIEIDFEVDEAPLSADPLLLTEAIGNLIDNALAYCPDGGWVRIATGLRSTPDGRQAVVRIEDNGPGIDPRQRERVLERFYRPSGCGGSGSGLGLPIASEVARRHGGQLQILDRVEGNPAAGTVIEMTLAAG